MEHEDKKQHWQCYIRLLKNFYYYVLVSQGLYFIPKFNPFREWADMFLGGHMMTIICLVMMVPTLYSLIKVTTIFDDLLRRKFLEGETPKQHFKQKISFLFQQKQFWLEAIIVVALYVISPLKWTCAAMADLFLMGSKSFGRKLVLLATLFPLLFVLNLAARFSAMEYWHAYQRGIVEIYNRKEKPKKTYEKHLSAALGINFFIGICLGIILPLVLGFVPVLTGLFTPKVIVFLAGLFLLYQSFRIVRLLLKRRAFIKRLVTLCKAKGYEVSDISRPYRSLFALYDGESFCVSSGEKQYSCKLISAAKKSVPLLFRADGICQFIHSKKLFHTEVYRRVRTYEFGYEADCKKILIINPVPRRVYNSQMAILDNGDRVGDYKIFSGTAFLNALERECVDKDI